MRKKLAEFSVFVVVVLLATFIYVNVGALFKERATAIQEHINLQYEYIEVEVFETTEGIPLGAP